MKRKAMYAETFLRGRGYSIVDKDISDSLKTLDVVAYDNKEKQLVFVSVMEGTESFPGFDGESKREEKEADAIAWFVDNMDEEQADMRMRFDEVAIIPRGTSVFVRHYINCLGY